MLRIEHKPHPGLRTGHGPLPPAGCMYWSVSAWVDGHVKRIGYVISPLITTTPTGWRYLPALVRLAGPGSKVVVPCKIF